MDDYKKTATDLSDKTTKLSYLLHLHVNKKLSEETVNEILKLHRDICEIEREMEKKLYE